MTSQEHHNTYNSIATTASCLCGVTIWFTTQMNYMRNLIVIIHYGVVMVDWKEFYLGKYSIWRKKHIYEIGNKNALWLITHALINRRIMEYNWNPMSSLKLQVIFANFYYYWYIDWQVFTISTRNSVCL